MVEIPNDKSLEERKNEKAVKELTNIFAKLGEKHSHICYEPEHLTPQELEIKNTPHLQIESEMLNQIWELKKSLKKNEYITVFSGKIEKIPKDRLDIVIKGFCRIALPCSDENHLISTRNGGFSGCRKVKEPNFLRGIFRKEDTIDFVNPTSIEILEFWKDQFIGLALDKIGWYYSVIKKR